MGKITIIESNQSVTVASTAGVAGAIVVVSDRGRANTATFIDTESKFVDRYGKPNPSKSVTPYSALMFLQGSSNLYVSRAIHTAPDGSVESDSNRTARFSAALVRGVVSALPVGIPDATYQPDRIIEPYTNADGYGLRQSDLDSFTFPLYSRKREYEKLNIKVVEDSSTRAMIVNSFGSLNEGDKLSFGDDVSDVSPVFTITDLKEVQVNNQYVKLDKVATVSKGDSIRRVSITKTDFDVPVTTTNQALVGADTVEVNSVAGVTQGQTIVFNDNELYQYVVKSVSGSSITLMTTLEEQVENGWSVKLMKREYSDYTGNPTVTNSANGSNEIQVSDVDYIGNNDLITFTAGLTNQSNEFTVTDKSVVKVTQNQIILDQATNTSVSTVIQLMTKSEFEMRDVLLVTSDNQGEWGNNVTVSIGESVDYPNTARFIYVYEDGVLAESYEVTFKSFVDGLGKQMYVEDVINNSSTRIQVKHNQEMVDSEGEPVLPLITDYAIWRENPTDVFEGTGYTLTESVVLGETQIRVTDNANLSIGDRVKFGLFDDEYKVTDKGSQSVGQATEYYIIVDRGIVVDKIDLGSQVYKYKEQELKPLSKLTQSYKTYNKGATLVISGKIGVLLDPGCSLFEGGNDGSTPTIGDMLTALKVFENRDEINVNLIMTGGVYAPAYANQIITMCKNRENSFGFLSNDPSALDNSDPVQATIDFRSNLTSSSYASLFSDWIVIYDSYTQKEVTVSVDGVAAALQTISSQSGVWGYVVAGWTRGVLFNTLRVYRPFSEAERELLLNSQINPVKVLKSRGLSIWGDKTLDPIRSKLQERHCRMLLMQLNIQLRDYLESVQWEFNDENVRSNVVFKIQKALNDEYSVVLEDSKVVDTTTSTDVDNGKMDIFVGIIPKSAAENINVTLGIFSSSQGISVVQ